MNEGNEKAFDCVAWIRSVRNRISADIQDMSPEERKAVAKGPVQRIRFWQGFLIVVGHRRVAGLWPDPSVASRFSFSEGR